MIIDELPYRPLLQARSSPTAAPQPSHASSEIAAHNASESAPHSSHTPSPAPSTAHPGPTPRSSPAPSAQLGTATDPHLSHVSAIVSGPRPPAVPMHGSTTPAPTLDSKSALPSFLAVSAYRGGDPARYSANASVAPTSLSPPPRHVIAFRHSKSTLPSSSAVSTSSVADPACYGASASVAPTSHSPPPRPVNAHADVIRFRARHPSYALPFVYVTSRSRRNGKYHYRMGCSTASEAITLDYAADQQREPCATCYPAK